MYEWKTFHINYSFSEFFHNLSAILQVYSFNLVSRAVINVIPFIGYLLQLFINCYVEYVLIHGDIQGDVNFLIFQTCLKTSLTRHKRRTKHLSGMLKSCSHVS